MPKKGKQSAKTEKEPRPSYKGVSKRLRAILAERECTIPEMMEALDVTESAVLDALRHLGKSKKGTLRSGMVRSRPCWWWQPAAPQTGDASGEAAGAAGAAGKK